ncbi:YXWGXW repeat-containing protein [Paludisphaera rhizosphaerae]|uniref:YXWGXW repeat-containing protein n=2 Tax=Paludisphaera rhizosphaerae TaxID=2711216 RepID=UPI0013EA14AD|nr:YXWGXW repeat-containing protein [Paludisphaera rhizosphaerae]
MFHTTGRCTMYRGSRTVVGVWLVGLSTIYVAARAQTPGAGDQAGVEVLTRGPVHEAFAVPVVNDPKPGLVVRKTPPKPIEEMPPDQKPAGDQVQWMPGYWSWDQGREDFVWVSGIWREPPPGRQWVPGYWNPIADGVQWVPGAWIPIANTAPGNLDASVVAAQGEAAYLPEPPASLEVGPNIPQPAGEVFWSPGCWMWRQTRYVWRPGFWAAVQPAWVWVPAHYVWTPGGFLFVDGFWDLPVIDRGILFAPVYYAQPVYLQPAYVYTPTITIAAPGLVANLFVQPTYNHYCFGDYYDPSFLAVGVFPSFSFAYVSGPRPPAFYDPLFTFYASVNVRSNPGWMAQCRQDYVQRRDHMDMRPPRTYIEQTRIVQTNINITRNTTIIREGGGRPGPGPQPGQLIGRPIEQVAMRRAETNGPRMERVDMAARQQWRSRSQELADFRVQRADREIAAGPRPGGGGPRLPQAQPLAQTRPRPFAMPASPVAAPLPDRTTIGPMRRPEHVEPSVTEKARQPMAPRHPVNRPEPMNRPAHTEAPVIANPTTPLPAHRPQPDSGRPAVAHRDGQDDAATGRPLTPRHLRPGVASRPAEAGDGPRSNVRRPPPTPRPAGAGPRRPAGVGARPGPDS